MGYEGALRHFKAYLKSVQKLLHVPLKLNFDSIQNGSAVPPTGLLLRKSIEVITHANDRMCMYTSTDMVGFKLKQ